MIKIDILNLPSNVPMLRLEHKISLLEKMHVFANEKKVTLIYLGGITNHGLKDEERKLFVRIPGHRSDLLIDRSAELDTLMKLVNEGLYPPIIEAYSKGELAGYKIEYYIEGETLQFDTFHLHQNLVLPALKELHDSDLQFTNEFNIFDRLSIMIETLQLNDIENISYFDAGVLSLISLESLKDYVNELQEKIAILFPYEIKLSPCHNDITPTNFIKLKYPVHQRSYQIIDWEYAGMNDPMYDVALLVAMLSLSPTRYSEFVLNYFNSTHEAQYTEEIKRVQFYAPLVKLYYGIWAALQVAISNESSSIDELRSGWGPQSITVFLEQYRSEDYQDLLHQTQGLSIHK